jgi:FtsH-binding integral membrane protein
MVELKQNTYSQSQSTAIDQGLRDYMMKVYNYMTSGLAISGLVAWGFSQSPTLMGAIYGTALQWVVMLAPLGFIFFLGARLQKMSLSAAKMTFWAFAAVMGISLSYIFIVFTGVSIVRVFLITSCTFAAMSIYGYTTKRDLTKFGSFLIMGLIGIIIASIVNIFLQSSAMQFVISCVGVLVFVGLTAYDTQRIKSTYYQVAGTAFAGKAAIMGALTLYLDFINLFIMLMQLFGQRR